MQSGGQSAGIQLQVGLDLAFFRQQLTTLGATAAGYKLPINVKFDRLSIQNELNTLGQNIKQRTYRLEVATNLSTEIKNAGTLAKALRGLDNAVQKNKGIANRTVAGATSGTVDASKIQTLVNKATRPALQALYSEMSKAKIPMMDVGKGAVKDLRESIISGVPGITQDIAKGLASGLNPELKENGTKGARIFIDAFKTAAGIASPSKVFKALGEFSADGLEIGFLNGLKDFKTKAVAEIKNIVKLLQQEARVGMIATGGLLSPIARPRTSATRTIPGMPSPRDVVSNQDPGRSNNRILNSLSLLTGDPKLYRSRMANLGANRLPSSLLGSAATQMNLEDIAPGFKQSRLGGTKTGVANIIDEAFFGRGTLPKASNALNGLSNTIERLASSARAAAPSGVLQSASGNPRFRAFGGIPSGQSMGIFPPTAQPTAYPPSGGFLEFSRRATAISAGLPGNVFGGRQPPSGPPGGPPNNPPGGGGSFPSDGMMGPSSTKSYEALSRLSGALRESSTFFNQSKIPLAGAIEELGGEFGQAAKQVLLYGTAYKALAFFTDLPRQVLAASTALQTFNNQLLAITGSSASANRSFSFVDELATRFNVPLESARQGFVKLYASMAPAGFETGQIESLYTGIAKTSATLGLSADKVDRVTYAFAQMASKGQLMAEEVTGQLGDVIPGALSIMAEAARMDIATFKKAMEDGAFVGKTFEQVMSNVPIVLERRFGKGAAGAANTLQGSMNALTTSTTKFYEAFNAVVTLGGASVFPLISNAIDQATKAANAFSSSLEGNASPASMLEGNAKNLYSVLSQLQEIFMAIGGIVRGIAPTFGMLGQSILGLASAISQLINTQVGGFLADLAVKAGVALIAIQLLIKTGVMLLASKLIAMANAAQLAGTGVMGFGASVVKTTTFVRLFRLALVGLTGGIILAGLEALYRHFERLANRLGDMRKKALEATEAIRSMSSTELVTEKRSIQKNITLLNKVQQAGGTVSSRADAEALRAMGMNVTTKSSSRRGAAGKDIFDYSVDPSLITSYLLKQEGFMAEVDRAYKNLDQPPPELGAVDLGAGTGSDAEAKKAEQERLRIESERQRRRIEAANHENSLMQINFQKDLQLTDAGFEHKKNMIDALHDYEMSGLNDMEARQKKFEKDLQDVQLQRVNAVRQALQKVVEAQVATQAAASVSRAAGGPTALSLPGPTGGGGAFDTGMRTGPSSAIGGSAPYHQDIMFGSTVSMKERVQLMDQLARGYEAMGRTIEFSNDAVKDERYRSSMSYEAKSSLISRAQAAHASRPGGSGRAAMDYYAPLASSNRFGASVEGQAMLAPSVEGASYSYGGGGGGGRTMTAFRNGKMVFEQLHGSMAVPLQSGAASKNATVNTMARRETTEARDEEKAQAQESAALSLANLDIQNQIALAYQQTATIIKQNIDSIYPIEKIKLENKLSQIRHDLQMQNMPEEVIAYEERRAAAVAEGAMAEEVLKKKVIDTEAQIKKTTAATAENKEQALAKSSALEILNKNLELYKQGLEDIPAKQQEMNVRLLEGALAAMKNADAIKAQQETMSLIKGSVESASNSYKGFMKEVAMGGDPSEALKKFQEAITDQVLTVFFDFAMKPVEDFFKNQLSAMFGVETEESAREKAIAKMEEQLAVQKSIEANVAKIAGVPATGSSATSASPSFTPGTTSSAVSTNGFPIAAPGGIVASMTEAAMNGAALPFETGTSDAANPVGAWGDSLNTQLSKSLTEATKTTDTEGNKLGESLGKAVGAVGMAAGAAMGIVAGIGQIKEGGTSNVLGGIGSVLMSLGGAVGGFAGFFKGANGGVAGGGWKPFPVRAFANGGMVNGPTLGLVGEGKYNEAIVPLPDGKSIPVQMRGGGGLREAMTGNNGGGRGGNTILSMNFETSTINGVEYVSRDQLEAAMAQTRKQASRDGANQGMTMTLDKLQQSPQTRNRLGLR